MVDMSEFIRSRRDRLEEDRERIIKPWAGGILPTDEGRAALNEEKRHQQKEEYMTYLQNKSNSLRQSRPKSVTELRQELSRKRDRELKNTLPPEPRRESVAKNERETSAGSRGDWDEEERGLMKWMWDKGKGKRETPAPQSYTRSLVPGLGMTMKDESGEEKRQRQSQYRSELRAQMKEKDRLLQENNGYNGSKMRTSSRKENRKSPVDHTSPRRPKESPPPHSHFRAGYRNDIPDETNHSSRYPPDRRYYEPPYIPPPYPPYTHYPSHTPYYYPPPYPPPPARGHYVPPPYHLEPYSDDPYMARSRRGRSPTSSRHGRSPTSSRRGRSPVSRSPSPVVEREELKLSRTKRNHDHLKTILKTKKGKENERENFIKRIEEDTYDPWGRPGGGAPLTDATGNLVTERGLLRKSFDELSPRISEEEKKLLQQEKQKEDLQRQIDEKEEQKTLAKLLKRREDMDEEQRIREEMNRLHVKTLQERVKEKERGELKGDELIVKPETPLFSNQELAQQKFKEELERQKKKKEDEQERLHKLADKMATSYAPFQYSRQGSPPLPTLSPYPPPKSPPIPTLRNQHLEATPPHSTPLPYMDVPSDITYVMPPSVTPGPTIFQTQCEPMISPSPAVVKLPVDGDILQNLSLLKHRLLKDLSHSHPRTHMTDSRPPYAQTDSYTHSQTGSHTHSQTGSHPPIRLRPTIPHPRPQPPSDTIDAFNKIKYTAPTSSRLSFWKQFPEPPRTKSDLEVQQDALLHHQRQHRERDIQPPLLPRVQSSQSRATINTLDINTLAARNEDRKRRLESILNARHQPSLGNSIMEQQNDRNYHMTPVTSNTSLDCDTGFQQIHDPPLSYWQD